MPGPHDIGGQDFGAIELAPRKKSPLDRRVDVLQNLVGARGARAYRVDELRRVIESIPPSYYYSYSYYERWLVAIRELLIEKEVLSLGELQARIESLRRGVTPRSES